MKRFHLHLAVSDLAANIAFYSRLFGSQPSVQKDDYAKWMLDDPRINFAISSRGAQVGLDHIGIQVESAQELDAVKQLYLAADAAAVTQQDDAACCYAQSNKYWLTDPQGIAWEAFHTLADIPVFGNGSGNRNDNDNGSKEAEPATPGQQETAACCAPRGKPLNIPVVSNGKSCC